MRMIKGRVGMGTEGWARGKLEGRVEERTRVSGGTVVLQERAEDRVVGRTEGKKSDGNR